MDFKNHSYIWLGVHLRALTLFVSKILRDTPDYKKTELQFLTKISSVYIAVKPTRSILN